MMNAKLPGIAREGLGLVSVAAGLCFLCLIFGFSFPSLVFLAATLFLLFFFRDPSREVPAVADGSVLSPADGRVVDVSETVERTYLDGKSRRISVFLSVFDCHVNRFPVSGKVAGTRYFPGKFAMAFGTDSSGSNERLSTLVELESGARVVIVQVAGFLARTIVSRVKLGDELEAGEKFGMIKFGSRVDLYLPVGTKVAVRAGQKVRAGETVVAWLN